MQPATGGETRGATHHFAILFEERDLVDVAVDLERVEEAGDHERVADVLAHQALHARRRSVIPLMVS